MSKPRSTASRPMPEVAKVSVVRTALAALLTAGGLGYVLWYVFSVYDDGTPTSVFELEDWNFLIGFGVMFVGLLLFSHPRTPLGRGRGVVVGMLGSFLIGLFWIVLYYVTSQDASIPLIRELGNYNLLVGVGFMAVGFAFATKWE
ncbi:cell division protein CrgA [Nocardioides caldifontis]|uniref:cell division protein CrgA n=1 Tax=Nocardioides caldifontis TaxID=2588938 RepID=UPI001EEFD077|nr:cell division protein CrgA [Nocardioides caldifontis]